MGKTPLRTVRVPDDIWERAVARAKENGEDVSKVIRRALLEYVTTPPPDGRRPAGT